MRVAFCRAAQLFLKKTKNTAAATSRVAQSDGEKGASRAAAPRAFRSGSEIDRPRLEKHELAQIPELFEIVPLPLLLLLLLAAVHTATL